MNGDRWSRPSPAAHAPDRSSRNLFRNQAGRRVPSLGVDRDDMFRIISGAYDIADRELARGMEIARSLRESSMASGLGEPADALRRSERLGQDSLMLLIEWAGLLTSPGATALLRRWTAGLPELESLLGRLLGGAGRTEEAAAPPPPAAPAPSGSPAPGGKIFAFRLRHLEQPPLPLTGWQGSGTWPAMPVELSFRCRAHPELSVPASLGAAEDGSPCLAIKLPHDMPDGLWRAALCEADGTQTGLLQFEL